ncbi:MAG: Gldg family protein [Sphingobium sp.]
MTGRRWLAGGVTALAGLAVLLLGMLPPHVMRTGQLDPRDWLLPALLVLPLAALLHGPFGARRWPVFLWSLLALAMPPLVLCVAGSAGQGGRLSAWLHPAPSRFPSAARRPTVGLLSGPVLHGPAAQGLLQGGFARAPLWHALSRRFDLHPLDALDERALAGLDALLLIQPRALAPDELVSLDKWVRMGGRAVLLADPDLRWADPRPLGHPLRAPPVTLLDPLLGHWGISLGPAPMRSGADPVERRFLDNGHMLQISGASHFLPDGKACRLSSRGLVARCRIGRGIAILVADADFANDALWTADPANPAHIGSWTSDAPALLADFLGDGQGNAAGRCIWLTRADGLPGAARPALAVLLLLSAMVSLSMGTKREKRSVSQIE